MRKSRLLHRGHTGCSFLLRAAVAIVALAAVTSCPRAAVTVTAGPHGQYSTIQAAVTQVIANGGGDVLVEVKFCHSPLGYDYVCPYVENLLIQTTGELNLRGGWHSDFASQYDDGTLSQIKGTGSIAPVMLLVAANGTIRVTNFDVDGTGVAGNSQTLGIAANSGASSLIVILGNRIHDHSLLTTAGTGYSGGAGIHAVANGANAKVTIDANEIFDNVVYGTDNAASYGGGVTLDTLSGGQGFFDLNDVHGNSVSNVNNGACHGGGLWARANTGYIQLDGNQYTGNMQFACSNGASGDAAEISAANSAEVDVRNERWTSNAVANDPGVYEVFMHAESDAAIYAGNGLVTHGTWGGLYASSDASNAHVVVANYTIADNPVLGFRGVGAGTQLWNTILWNDGTPYELDSGASFAYYLFASDPLFVDAANGNYRLSKGSPAINAGANAPAGGGYATDLDGVTRPYTGDGLALTDIGAYEFHDDTLFKNGFEQQL